MVWWAVNRNNYPVVRLLLERGADIDGTVGTNPLINAASLANVTMVAELLAHGANVHVANKVETTNVGIFLLLLCVLQLV